MSLTAYEYWFPEYGETREDAQTIKAPDAKSAAERVAERRCAQDIEWQAHEVHIGFGHRVMKFDVEFRSEPVFSARELTATL
ncbi:hypothetical protein AB1P65_09610 [Roseibium alexandrii]